MPKSEKVKISIFLKIHGDGFDLGNSGSRVKLPDRTKTQRSEECMIQFPRMISISEASRLIGGKVVWSNGQKKIVRKLVALHGKKD